MTGAEAPRPGTYTYELANAEQELLLGIMVGGNYRKREVPYALWSIEGDRFNATLYQKERNGRRKLCVQGAKAGDFVEFVLQPGGVVPVTMGGGVAASGAGGPAGETAPLPHGGSDESGKGDYFGPLVVACCYVDEASAAKLRGLRVEWFDSRDVKHVDRGGVRDCKLISNNAVLLRMGQMIRALLGPERFAVVKFGPAAYNRCYAKFRNINRMLAWAHGTCIEELLTRQPACPRIVVDQFARVPLTDASGAPQKDARGHVLEDAARSQAVLARALKERGRRVELEQRHKAEAYSVAVAAASVLAREEFLRALCGIADEIEPGARNPLEVMPIGSSDPRIREIAEGMVRKHGPVWLMNHCKAHFQTTDKVLAACGRSRADLPPEGRVVSASQSR